MKTIAVLLTLCAIPALSQEPKFEVASIKKSAPDAKGMLYHLPGGRFKVQSLTLLSLASFAYEVPESQITGLPNWASTDRFDIEATADMPPEFDPKKMETPAKKAMVRQLLAERFQLQVRREEREVPIYSLVASPGGPKMERNTGERYFIQSSRRFQKVSMADLAKFLSTNLREEVGRAVVDKTGLDGEFNFRLTWGPLKSDGTSRDLPSIFAAIQQIGLKLQSDRGAVPYLTVLNAAPPSEN